MVLVRPLPVEIPPPRVQHAFGPRVFFSTSESWALVMFNIQLCQTRRFLRSLILDSVSTSEDVSSFLPNLVCSSRCLRCRDRRGVGRDMGHIVCMPFLHALAYCSQGQPILTTFPHLSLPVSESHACNFFSLTFGNFHRSPSSPTCQCASCRFLFTVCERLPEVTPRNITANSNFVRCGGRSSL